MVHTPNPVQLVKGFAQKAENIQVGIQTIKVQRSYPGAKVEVLQYNDEDSVEIKAYRYDQYGVRQNDNFVTAHPTTALYELFLETGYYNLKFSGADIPTPFKLPVKVESRTFNVRDFGAKGDGVTDDTQAIVDALQTMVDSNPNTEGLGTLFFPSGRYIVRRPSELHTAVIDLPSGIVVQGTGGPYSGVGTSNCQIVLDDTISIFRIRTNRHKITIRDIGLTTTSVEPVGFAIDARDVEENFEDTYTSDIEINNVTFWNFERAISIEGSGSTMQWDITSVLVNHCHIVECLYGIYVNSENCSFLKIQDSRVGVITSGFGIYLERSGIMTIDSILGAGPVTTDPLVRANTFIYITAAHRTITISGCECEGYNNSIQIVPLNVGNFSWPILLINCAFGPRIQISSECEIVSVASKYLPTTVHCDPNAKVMIYSFGDSMVDENKQPNPLYDFNLHGSDTRLVSRANRYRVDFQRPGRFGGQAGQIASWLEHTPLAVSQFETGDAQVALCNPAGNVIFHIRAEDGFLYFEDASHERLMRLDFKGDLVIKGTLTESGNP